ncbi:hypothetical protein BZG36_01208 [Bifiguratus adelaidae]|uniref:Trafficking protein particle complex subunit 6B n=1 Tax=Bifiguratus adelaidae TaxID=1938954 RepID=A0A261Y5S0_9FUNG|nr:hypothetical protein BZG36_01208 [Bifiguratus adelaidae]
MSRTSEDGTLSLVSESCMDFLLPEILNMMYRTNHAEDIENDAIYYKLESLGFTVGQSLAEKFTQDRPRFVDTLDVVKFVCKDLWTVAFKKQVDNLKTNRRGVYVLQDNNFRWFMRMSLDADPAEATKRAAPYLWFPCGLIRGALANLGVSSVVMAETSNIPQCTFQIRIAQR